MGDRAVLSSSPSSSSKDLVGAPGSGHLRGSHPSHGQRLKLRVTDASAEPGVDQLQIALADLVFTTALLQEVDLGGELKRGSFSGSECVAKACGRVGDQRSKQPGFNLQICCLPAV